MYTLELVLLLMMLIAPMGRKWILGTCRVFGHPHHHHALLCASTCRIKQLLCSESWIIRDSLIFPT